MNHDIEAQNNVPPDVYLRRIGAPALPGLEEWVYGTKADSKGGKLTVLPQSFR